MKKTTKALLSAMLALVLAFSMLPASLNAGVGAPDHRAAPAGYNANDYEKCVSFLEETDEHGVKNGQKLNGNYDPNAPATWTGIQWDSWNDEMRLVDISLWNFSGLVGTLDVSGCEYLIRVDIMDNDVSALNVSGCTLLMYLDCSGNEISALDVSDCTLIEFLYCDKTAITELDVSALTNLTELDCNDTLISSLDVSNCPALTALYSYNNFVKTLDLSNNPLLVYDMIKAEGNGYIGYRFVSKDGWGDVLAYPANGADFVGFYDENGKLLDEGYFDNLDGAYIYSFMDGDTGSVIARFEGGDSPLKGDVDLNGSVDINDVLLALRGVLGLVELEPLSVLAGDMDENGGVDINDVMAILRLTLGIA